MSEPEPLSYAFGRFHYDGVQAKLLLEGREIPLTGRELHLLVIFLSRPAEWMEEAWLASGLWPRAVPPTGELDRLVRALTSALDEGADGVATIQKVTGRGFRLLIPVRPLGTEGSQSAPAKAHSGERPAAVPGGRSAHRSLISRRQLITGLLVAAAVAVMALWWIGPPAREDANRDQGVAGARETLAMRAAAAAELQKGVTAARGFDLASRRAAITHFEAALQLDSGARNQTGAHAGLANVLVLEGDLERARLEAQAALASNIALGPGAQLAEPQAALAFTQLFLGRNPSAARGTAERALGIDALHVGGRRALVWVSAVEGRFDDAFKELGPLRNSATFDPEVSTDEAWMLYLSGRPLEARQLLTTVVRREPLFRRAHATLAALHLSERRLAAAAIEFELLDALSSGKSNDDERLRPRIRGDWMLPDASEAARLLEERAAAAGSQSPGGAMGAQIQAARIYAQFGKDDLTLAALGRALERRESGAVLARIDPAFVALRGNAAFRTLLDNAGVPELVKPDSKP